MAKTLEQPALDTFFDRLISIVSAQSMASHLPARSTSSCIHKCCKYERIHTAASLQTIDTSEEHCLSHAVFHEATFLHLGTGKGGDLSEQTTNHETRRTRSSAMSAAQADL